MSQPYTLSERLQARIECLMRLGYSEDDAIVIVLETYGLPRA